VSIVLMVGLVLFGIVALALCWLGFCFAMSMVLDNIFP
jgi:hypothetical protein